MRVERPHDLSRDVLSQTPVIGHAYSGDYEGLFKDIQLLGEGACGIAEMLISTVSVAMRCAKNSIGRPNLLKPQNMVTAAFA
jgi:hypothetical protein